MMLTPSTTAINAATHYNNNNNINYLLQTHRCDEHRAPGQTKEPPQKAGKRGKRGKRKSAAADDAAAALALATAAAMDVDSDAANDDGLCPCGEPDSEGETYIQCEQCQQWVHTRCAGLPPDTTAEDWRCDVCTGVSSGTGRRKKGSGRRASAAGGRTFSTAVEISGSLGKVCTVTVNFSNSDCTTQQYHVCTT
jgi:PHD-finger